MAQANDFTRTSWGTILDKGGIHMAAMHAWSGVRSMAATHGPRGVILEGLSVK